MLSGDPSPPAWGRSVDASVPAPSSGHGSAVREAYAAYRYAVYG